MLRLARLEKTSDVWREKLLLGDVKFQMLREALAADAVESGEGADASGKGVVWRAAWSHFDGGEHEIFGGVLGGNELEDLGAIAGPFQQHGAQGVGHEFGLTFLENPVAQRIGQHGGSGELRAKFFLAAGRDNEQTGAGGETLGESVVGGGVAGVQGDENIHIDESDGGDVARDEAEVGQLAFLGESVAEIDQRGAGLDAGHIGAAAEVGGEREGEVAFAATHVGDF